MDKECRVTDEQVRGFIHCLPSLDLLSVDREVLFSECSRIRGFPSLIMSFVLWSVRNDTVD